VILFKNKFFGFIKRAKQALSFVNVFKKDKFNQTELDKKLIYSLSPHKIPNRGQIKYIKKFLNPRENLIIKICLLLILINAVYLINVFIQKRIELSPLAGGDYVEAVVGYPRTINPLYAFNRDVDSDLSRLIYSSLFVYNTDAKLISDLAENYKIENSGKEYYITIKSGVKWHNGDPLTVDDIIFTFNLIKNVDYRSPLRSSLAGIEIEKIDDINLKFTLSESYAPFLELLTFGILPKNIWENVGPTSIALSDFNLKPIGSGPYKFKSLLKNKNGDLKEYKLTVNNDYYSGAPYLKNIIFKFFVNYSEAIKSFNGNKIDGLSYLPFNERKEVLAQNSVLMHELVLPKIVSVFFNQEKNKSLEDKNVRIALAQALDKAQIINDVFSGVYQKADGPILENNFAYNQEIKKYNFSPGEAVEVLKNKPVELSLTVIDSGLNLVVAEQIKSYWEKAGAKVNIKVISSDQALTVIRNRDFEALIYGESVGGDPDVFAFWHSSQTGSKGLNLSNYNNSEVDKLLVDARSSVDLAERIEKYQKFQEIITNDVPTIFLYVPTYTYVQSKKVRGFNGTALIESADRFTDVSQWYIKTKKKIIW